MEQTAIERHRLRKGWTRAQFGVKAQVSERTISNLERGETKGPTRAITQKGIAAALGVKPAVLFDKGGKAR